MPDGVDLNPVPGGFRCRIVKECNEETYEV